MKKLLTVLALVAAPMLATAGTITTGVDSSYNFRGIEYSNAPSYRISYEAEKFGLLDYSVEARTLQNKKQYEVDTSVGMHYNLAGLYIKAGGTAYMYTGADSVLSNSTELYAGIGTVVYDTNFSVVGYFSHQNGWYDIEVSRNLYGADLTVGTSYATYRTQKDDFEQVYMKVSYGITDHITVGGEANWAMRDKSIAGVKTKNLASAFVEYSM